MTLKSNNIPVGYKDSPLGIIPMEWEVKRLGEICTYFKSGKSITTSNLNNDGCYPVYGGNGLRGFSCDYTHDGTYILIGRQGALCGNINYVEGKNYISEHAIAVQSRENMLWLKYKLEYWNLNRYSESSAQPGLSVEKLVRYKLTIPPLAEQEKIAEILSTWDKAIEKQTQLIQKLELRKKGLMQQLLTGKKRLPGFYKPYQKTKLEEANKKIGEEENNKVKINNSPFIPQGYKSTILGIIPKEWEVKKLGEILAIGNGKDYNSLASGDIPVFGTGGIICYVDDYLYCGDTVCIGRKGTIDKPIYYSGKIWTVDTLFYTYGYKATTAKYLYLLFQIINWKKYNEATGVPSLSKSTIERIMIPLPPLSEQQKIVEVFIAVDREIEILQTKSEQLRQQKLGLMQQLLTGKKRVI